MNAKLNEAIRLGIKPPFSGPLNEFAAQFVLEKGYAWQGPFSIEDTKYLGPFMAHLTNTAKRIVLALKAVQTGGSMAGLHLFIPHLILNESGDILVLFAQGDDFASEYFTERQLPTY